MAKDPVTARDLDARTSTVYPAEFAHVTEGRSKRALGTAFGLDQFGVNLTDLAPGSASALKHWHTAEDELVYVLDGEVTLLLGDEERVMRAGDIIGFKAGDPIGHAIVNRSDKTATLLEIGSRRMDVDEAFYPGADLKAGPDGAGDRLLTRADGSPIKGWMRVRRSVDWPGSKRNGSSRMRPAIRHTSTICRSEARPHRSKP